MYESSFHPDTGEKQNVFGRMSFQVPGGMAITGAMLQFYRFVLGLIEDKIAVSLLLYLCFYFTQGICFVLNLK